MREAIERLREARERYRDEADYGKSTWAADNMAEAVDALLALPHVEEGTAWCFDMEKAPEDTGLYITCLEYMGCDDDPIPYVWLGWYRTSKQERWWSAAHDEHPSEPYAWMLAPTPTKFPDPAAPPQLNEGVR